MPLTLYRQLSVEIEVRLEPGQPGLGEIAQTLRTYMVTPGCGVLTLTGVSLTLILNLISTAKFNSDLEKRCTNVSLTGDSA